MPASAKKWLRGSEAPGNLQLSSRWRRRGAYWLGRILGMPEDPPANAAAQRFERAKSAGVPQVYANGFANTLGVGDIVVILERNDQPAAIVNLSYTVAKTLSLSLSRAIALLEERSGREIMTTHEIEKMFNEEKETRES